MQKSASLSTRSYRALHLHLSKRYHISRIVCLLIGRAHQFFFWHYLFLLVIKNTFYQGLHKATALSTLGDLTALCYGLFLYTF